MRAYALGKTAIKTASIALPDSLAVKTAAEIAAERAHKILTTFIGVLIFEIVKYFKKNSLISGIKVTSQ